MCGGSVWMRGRASMQPHKLLHYNAFTIKGPPYCYACEMCLQPTSLLQPREDMVTISGCLCSRTSAGYQRSLKHDMLLHTSNFYDASGATPEPKSTLLCSGNKFWEQKSDVLPSNVHRFPSPRSGRSTNQPPHLEHAMSASTLPRKLWLCSWLSAAGPQCQCNLPPFFFFNNDPSAPVAEIGWSAGGRILPSGLMMCFLKSPAAQRRIISNRGKWNSTTTKKYTHIKQIPNFGEQEKVERTSG